MFKLLIKTAAQRAKDKTYMMELRRCSHTDLKVPDFSKDRRHSVNDPNKLNKSDENRKAFTYLIFGGKIDALQNEL